MPPRRTSPRRSTTRPTVPYTTYERDDDGAFEPGPRGGALASAAPWLALGALAIAAVALALTFFGRSGNLDACRRAAWAAVPSANDMPTGWTLSSTDLNANGMTVSITGQAPPDGSSSAPIIYASVTCYGDVAETAIDQYRAAAKAANAKVIDRGQGGDAYDVDNSSTTGSVTTLFRVGGLIGQVAVGGFVDAPDLAKITGAVAAAMGDRTAAGTGGDQAGASPPASFDAGGAEPSGSDDLGSPEPPAAPELEAHLPTDIAGTALTVQSGNAAQGLGADPNSRALAAAMRGIGVKLEDLQIAQAADPNAQVDPSTALDLDIFAFRVPGGDVTKLRGAVIDSWLSATAPGVKQTQVKLAGKSFTKIDYGDGGRLDYVFSGNGYVVVVETSDADIATEVAGKLK